MATNPRTSFPFPSLTPADFRAWLAGRLAAGWTRQALGANLGVSGMAVTRWLSGKAGVSATVLLLAERIMRERAGSWPLFRAE